MVRQAHAQAEEVGFERPGGQHGAVVGRLGGQGEIDRVGHKAKGGNVLQQGLVCEVADMCVKLIAHIGIQGIVEGSSAPQKG